MAKNDDKKLEKRLWDGVSEDDFDKERDIENVDIAEYDKKNMTLFASNINLFRQIIRLSDSLKPVERRILYALYLAKAFPGRKLKSTMISGYTAVYHCHGDSYPAMVGMAQSWKKPCPLIDGKGNFGNAAGELYAANRYTEASMSKYAKECFFDDYDDDCVEMVFNSASDLYEPISLPAKFPNILVNGGMGIAFGNAFRIPTYNINDIVDVCKRVIENPETANVYMIPDLPSNCQIIDDGESFKEIIDNGKGVLKMRADAEIIEGNRNWIIKITSLPWMTSLSGIKEKLVVLTKSGALPIKDTQDHSYAVKDRDGNVKTRVDFRVICDKAHDPYNILSKLYTMTDLQKSVAVDFKVVLDNLTVRRLNMRDLINSWLDERRSYKRRLFNKKLTKISARIDLLEILIHLLKEENIEKTLKIIKSSDSSEAIEKLMKLGKMTSYQAAKVYDMRLSAFTKDARKKYKEERESLLDERAKLMKTIGSEKKIDKIILEELEDLRKYATPRKSKIVAEETGTRISDTNHSIVISDGNMLKKLAYDSNNPSKNANMGSFKTGDFPVHHCVIHNTSSITLFDTFGRYSIIPVHSIDNTETSSYGHKIYDLAKLSGKIIRCMETYDNDLIEVMKKKVGEPYLLTITKRGYAKKTPISVYTDMKNSKNIRAMKIRDDDSMIAADVMFENSNIIIYTKKGDYAILRMKDIGEQAKDSMGLITMRVADDDEVAGFSAIGIDDDYIVIISDKGQVKKVAIKYFGAPGKRGSIKDMGSMMTLDPTDSIRFVSGMRDGQDVAVAMRNSVTFLSGYDIPDQTKKAKGKKMVFPSGNINIVGASVVDRNK